MQFTKEQCVLSSTSFRITPPISIGTQLLIFITYCINDTFRWFQEARKSRDNPYRDYYVWSDTNTKYKDARIIFVDTEPCNWVSSNKGN